MGKFKTVFTIFLCLFYLTTILQGNVSAYQQGNISANNSISIKFNGTRLNFTNKPKIHNGRILVPVAEFVSRMGATVEWRQDTSSVVILLNTPETRVILLKIGQAAALVNGVEFDLDAAPAIYNKTTFVPLGFISECLGANIQWASKTKTVDITYKAPMKEAPPVLIPPWELQITTGQAIQEEIKGAGQ